MLFVAVMAALFVAPKLAFARERVAPSPRRHDLDALRAVAMLLGIALHGALSFAGTPWLVQDSRQNVGYALFFSAVHGFRMPVFFLLSGFFTAMLWRRRGLRSLLGHRVRRILLPLLLGLVTIVPATILASGMAATAGSKPAEAFDGDLWSAAKEGNVAAIGSHIANGADIDTFDATYGVTPLAAATLWNHPEAVEALLNKGANVDARLRDGTTALHAAAFLGRVECAEILLKHGADIGAKSGINQTPVDSLVAAWEITQFIAGILEIEIDKDEVFAGREKIGDLFKAAGADVGETPEATSDKEASSLAKIVAALTVIPLFHHLWFLWFLCWLVVGFAVYATVADRFNWRLRARWLILSPARFLWLVPLTMIPQWFMGALGPTFGPDTSIGLLPMPHVLAYYAIFFVYGALYYDCDDAEGRVGNQWQWVAPTALLCIFPAALSFTFAEGVLKEALSPELRRLIGGFFEVVYTWMMTFGLMGLFRALLTRENKAIRYVSDSSYWLYLAHLPLIISAQTVVRDWPLPSFVKFALVCGVVTAFLLLTYEWVIRYTWVGKLLNGPRQRPAKQAPQPTV